MARGIDTGANPARQVGNNAGALRSSAASALNAYNPSDIDAALSENSRKSVGREPMSAKIDRLMDSAAAPYDYSTESDFQVMQGWGEHDPHFEGREPQQDRGEYTLHKTPSRMGRLEAWGPAHSQNNFDAIQYHKKMGIPVHKTMPGMPAEIVDTDK